MKDPAVQNQTGFNNKKNFILLEVLIVLLVISFPVVAAIPQATQSLRFYRLESTSGLLSNRLAGARLTAIKYNLPVWLEIESTAGRHEVWATNQDNQPITTKLAISIPSGLSIDSGIPTHITFNSLGRNQANSIVAVNLGLA